MTKALLINSIEKTVTLVEVGEGIQDIYKYLDCQTFDVVRLGGGVDCYIDDEGLLKNGYVDDDGVKHNMTGFIFKGMAQPIMGNGLVMGHNAEGESVDCPVSVEMVTGVMNFVEYDNPDDRPEPFVEFMSF
jgi:hypothetical protein